MATRTMRMQNDEGILASLGYKQEFRRQFSLVELFGLGFSIIGVVASMSSVIIYSIPNGGTSAMVWGWVVCSILLTCIGLSISELASLAPTSGGLYYWTYTFSSNGWRCFLSWIVGYSNTIGNIASVASIEWGCAVQIMAAASIGSDFTFHPTVAQHYGIYCALVLVHSLINTVDPKLIARVQMSFVVLNVLYYVSRVFGAVIISLPAATPRESMNSAKFAFGDFTNLSGWPDGFAFILSFLAPLWTMCCFDAPVHMSEEATNASFAVPFTIMSMTLSGLLCGWALNVTMAFCMGTDYEQILDNPTQQPMATILFNSLGKRGALAIWSLVIVVQFMIGLTIMTTCSRQMFAFSRDGGLPLSRWIYHLNPRTRTPIRAVWTAGFLCLILGTIAFAGPYAIGAVFSLVVTSQYVSYMIPISARFLGKKQLQPGPFNLGKLSFPVAVVAVVWMAFMTVVFMFPLTPHPGVGNMNYTVVVQGGVLILAAVYFYFPKYGGKYWFTGPIATISDNSFEDIPAFKEAV